MNLNNREKPGITSCLGQFDHSFAPDALAKTIYLAGLVDAQVHSSFASVYWIHVFQPLQKL
jgi:hypothetical protein